MFVLIWSNLFLNATGCHHRLIGMDTVIDAAPILIKSHAWLYDAQVLQSQGTTKGESGRKKPHLLLMMLLSAARNLTHISGCLISCHPHNLSLAIMVVALCCCCLFLLHSLFRSLEVNSTSIYHCVHWNTQGNLVAIKHVNKKRIELTRQVLLDLKHVSCVILVITLQFLLLCIHTINAKNVKIVLDVNTETASPSKRWCISLKALNTYIS